MYKATNRCHSRPLALPARLSLLLLLLPAGLLLQACLQVHLVHLLSRLLGHLLSRRDWSLVLQGPRRGLGLVVSHSIAYVDAAVVANGHRPHKASAV